MRRVATLPRLLLFLCLSLTLVDYASAQTTGGRIQGLVTDPNGASIPAAKVTLINQATGVTSSAETNGSGDYTFLQVPVGTYTLEVEQPGFKKDVHQNIVVQINDVLTIDISLQLGSLTDTVNVTTEAPLVDTTTTQLGAVVNERAIVKLPLNARDTYALLQLQPGVQSQVGSDLFYGSDSPGVVSVNGGRGRSNNYSVNGGDGNDQFANLPKIQPAPDSIQEFRVLTNTFDAEYGRNSGAVVNVVTKSGSSSFHGNVYEFFRDKSLNARGFFDAVKPAQRQNQFGGTFGGPISKERTFFFVSYEGRRIREGAPSDTVTVPTAEERIGDFSAGSTFAGTLTDQTVADVLNGRSGCSAAIAALGGTIPAAGVPWGDVGGIFPTNVIPAVCLDPVAVDLLNQFVPLPNRPDGTFQTIPVGRDRADQFTARIDHRINSKQQLSGYYYFNDSTAFNPFAKFQAGGANLPGFGARSKERVQQINLTHTWTLSPTAVNEGRFAYFRSAQGTFLHPERTHLVTDSCVSPAAKPFCFTGVPDSGAYASLPGGNIGITPGLGADREGVPFITISGAFNIGNNFEGEIPQRGNTFQLTDNLTKVKGKHTMKFGVDLRKQHFDQTLYFNVNGTFFYFGGGDNDVGFDSLIPNYLLGLPDQYQQGSAQTLNVRSTALYLFGQDSWKIRPNLTLNYGLRWELNTPMYDTGNRLQTFRPGQATKTFPCVISDAALGIYPTGTDCNPGGPAQSIFPLGLLVPGDAGVPKGLTQTYHKAFAPRIGLAWSPGWKKNWLTGGPGKTSVRMGFGIFYNPIEQLVLEQFSAEPPFGGSPLLNATFFQTPFQQQGGGQYPNPFNGILSPAPGQNIDWSIFRPILLFGEFEPHLRTQYSEQYNFTIQRELSHNLVLQIGYVGSQGHHLLATHDINFGNAQTCNDLTASGVDCSTFGADSSYEVPAGTVIAPQGLHLPYGSVPFIPGGTVIGPDGITLVGLRRYSSPLCEPTTGAGCPPDGIPVFSSIFAQDTIANSSYNSLQMSLEKRFSGGLQFQAAYTFSKSIDNGSSFESILNPLNTRLRSLSLFDARHRFVFSYVWELPLPKYVGIKGKLLNGWALSGITTLQSGFPIRITSSDDIEEMNSFDFELPGQPNFNGLFHTVDPRNNSLCALGTGPNGGLGLPCQTGTYYFDPNLFSNDTVPLGGFGSAPRTICCGPRINNTDLSIQKITAVSEGKQLEFRAEFFNLFNHTQFFNPDGNITDGSDFGRVRRARSPREVQFAFKFSF